MSWTAVHQFVPTLLRGDAIGEHALRIRDQQRARGRSSEIFVDVGHHETDHETHSLDQIDRFVQPGTTLFSYHMAQASRCAAFFLERSEPLALHFHNLTPAELLAGWDPATACLLMDAQHQLNTLVDRSLIAICDSHYNARHLNDMGLAATQVVQLPVDPPSNTASQGPHPPTVLFVGRVAPHKGFHDVIHAIALLRLRLPDIQLRFIGPPTSDRYSTALTHLVRECNLGDVVTFSGRVSDADLTEAYAMADVFCCLSDHEGFGLPILEAMSHGLPVVAFNSSAVGETVGPAGILLNTKEPSTVAAALERVLSDRLLSSRLGAAGKSRAAKFTPERCDTQMETALEVAWKANQRR